MAGRRKQKQDKSEEVRREAGGLLCAIAERKKRISEISAEAELRMRELREAFAESTAYLHEEVAELEKDLRRLAKKNKPVFFPEGADRCDLSEGALLLHIEARVVKARAVTADKLEAMGYADAVRVAKSVNWDELEKWSDELLEQVGTRRKTEEKVEYEL